MEAEKLDIEGVYLLHNFNAQDERGSFTKCFNADEMDRLGLQHDFKESYYSVSKKNTIRGMHFQLPPYEHVKLTHLITGHAIDVILDIRYDSPTYGKFLQVEMTAGDKQSVYIPVGCAHGFISLEDDTTMIYYVTSVYDRDSDSGIAYDSFGLDWNCSSPIISGRDTTFVQLKDFVSPFRI